MVANHWRIIAEQGVTLGGGVPTMIAAAADALLDGADLGRLRLCIVGGSICPPEIEKRFLGVWPSDCLRQIYGMTEFAGSITQTPHDRAQESASAGLPVALAEVAVLSGAGASRPFDADRRDPCQGTADVCGLSRAAAGGATFL